jgi:hypothetical protein
MLLLIDENVPDPVTAIYRDRGHEVLLVRDLFPAGTADEVIARRANDLGAVVVTWNYKHFRAFAARKTRRGTFRYPRLGLITYEVPYPEGVERTQRHIRLVENEYDYTQEQGDRLHVHIGRTFCRISR